ncbi:TrbC/VirB2 family protein [uncultured Stenotrophomonas sp.]|uniref:TrbC/VirB2 family protein n=1 Tax=uncultured Stenotrophomonas sp. TaxID=165438 RepID=UPI0025FD92ED|nr:TrbC/VirB2 family protein [uncultured Stenotrophomonas sp.]
MIFKRAGGKLARILCHPGTRTLLLMILLLCAAQVMASDAGDGSGGAGLPWEGPLKKLNNSISGPVAFTISLLGILAAGAGLIWGGEISAFMKVVLYVVLVISLVVFAKNFLTGTMFSGATVPEQATSIRQAPSLGTGS